MIAIIGIVAMALFGGGVYLFRSAGRMQPPSPKERLRHNQTEHPKHQRAVGLD